MPSKQRLYLLAHTALVIETWTVTRFIVVGLHHMRSFRKAMRLRHFEVFQFSLMWHTFRKFTSFYLWSLSPTGVRCSPQSFTRKHLDFHQNDRINWHVEQLECICRPCHWSNVQWHDRVAIGEVNTPSPWFQHTHIVSPLPVSRIGSCLLTNDRSFQSFSCECNHS